VKRLFLGCLVAVLVLTLSAGLARGAATVFTQTFHNVTQTFTPPDPMASNPCTGAPGTLTITYNGVFHITTLPSGEFWLTNTLAGDFTLVPVAAGLPTLMGHFAAWFGISSNERNAVFHDTLNIHGTGSDGSVFTYHAVMHFSVSATGEVISFSKITCG
jgi:hypothetical protein